MTMTEKLERVAIVGADPAYTPYGYVITEEGIIYSLTVQWTHGVILALLYPGAAADAGYEPVDMDDYNVFEYQRFELDNHSRFPVIRVAIGTLFSFNVSKGDGPATQAQITALSKILKCQDISLNDEVQTDAMDMTARRMLELMAKSNDDKYDNEEGRVVRRPLKGLSKEVE